MVQLIRLTTDDNNAYFNNTFNQDIVIERNSKIALKNLSCEVNVTEINVNFSNNIIRYQITDDNKKEVFLSKGIYNRSNYFDLLNDMTLKLNSSLLIDINSEVGKQFKVYSENSILHIETKVGYSSDYEDDQVRSAYLTKTQTNRGTYRKLKSSDDGYPVGGYDENIIQFFTIHKAICKGAAVFRCDIRITGNNENERIAGIALFKNQLSGNDTIEIEQSYVSLFFNYNTTTSKYEYGKYTNDTKSVLSNIEPLVGDQLYIIIENNKIKLRMYRSVESSFNNFGEIPYDNEDLYPVLMVQGTQELSKVKFTPDPWYTDIPEIIVEEDILIVGPYQRKIQTNHFFEFDSEDLAKFLGFENKRIPRLGTTTTQNFDIKSFNFNPSDLSESYIVELLNIPLLSFNAAKKQRQNILDTIVNTEITNDRLAYTAPYPLYINLDNSDKIILRNIKAQILKEDGSPVTINGFAQMTLLIDN